MKIFFDNGGSKILGGISGAILFILFIMASSVYAVELRAMPEADSELSSRTVFFHDGDGSRRVSTGVCGSGFYEMTNASGRRMFSFIQPCGFASVSLDGRRDASLQAGIGLIEAMNMFSFNLALDSRDGDVIWGSGISLKFDDSFRFSASVE